MATILQTTYLNLFLWMKINYYILITISMSFVPENLIDNKLILLQAMAWC